MLFDLSPFRTPLPARVQVFASGANRKPEIEGFGLLGIPVGVSVNHLNEASITALIEHRQPVMIDSGAFSEVSFTDGAPHISRPIDDQEWRRRLAIYLRLATALGEKAMVVVPDQVGNQQETLRRLALYRGELSALSRTGAVLLLPLQIGCMSHPEFYEAAQRAAGVILTPAMPMRKAATKAEDLAGFVEQVRPPHLHLLGMGIDHPRAEPIIRLIAHYSPQTSISMDSNRLRALAGKQRALTRCEAELRSQPAEDLYGAVESPVLAATGMFLDYTDLIASPSLWIDTDGIEAIASGACLDTEETNNLLGDPDSFLQSPFRKSGDLTWIEYPLMSLALDQAWERFIAESIRHRVRTAAIAAVFGDSRINGQLS